MRAVIPVAGVGTRLRPHTYSLPKVLLNVAGKPILGHILTALQDQGVKKATIITGYMGKLVEEYVTEKFDMDFQFVTQEKRLGLGHAIWLAMKDVEDEPLMIILGDTIFDADLSNAVNLGVSALGVKEVDDPRRFGVVVADENNIITKLIEKPEEPISNLALVGIYYVLNQALLKESLDELIEKEIKTKSEFQLTDALQIMIEKGEKFKPFKIEGWFDCGKPETLLSTNRFLLEKQHKPKECKNSIIIPPVYIGENATVEKSVIGPNATIADGAFVTHSIIRDSIISDGASVSTSLLDQSIVGNNAVLEGHYTTMNIGSSSEIRNP